MKTYISICLIAVIAITSSCKKSSIAKNIPQCIRSTVTANKDNPNWTVGSVEEYEFQGRIVYAFNPDNEIIADASTDIVTEDCSNLCSVGGFGGPNANMCNGENFIKNAVLKRTIWEK
jgi:hypothetical protein